MVAMDSVLAVAGISWPGISSIRRRWVQRDRGCAFRSFNEEQGTDLIPLGDWANIYDLAEKQVSRELVLHIEAECFSGFEPLGCRHNEASPRKMVERGVHELTGRRGEFQIYPNWDAPKAFVFHAQHRADTAKEFAAE